jgi:hypothetical protein
VHPRVARAFAKIDGFKDIEKHIRNRSAIGAVILRRTMKSEPNNIACTVPIVGNRAVSNDIRCSINQKMLNLNAQNTVTHKRRNVLMRDLIDCPYACAGPNDGMHRPKWSMTWTTAEVVSIRLHS